MTVSDAGWNYIGFSHGATRKAYFGLDGSGNPQWGSDSGTFSITGNYTTIGTSTRSPIFYDSDNTGYYLDPNSGASLLVDSTTFVFNGGSTGSAGPIITSSATGGPKLSLKSTDTGGKDIWLISNATGNGDGAGKLQLWNNTNAYTAATFATTSSMVHMLYGAYTEMSGSSRAPIFYDSGNTGYYVDPASTSNVYGMVSYSYQGNGNVGGTGSASWHPSGVYSAGNNWLYGGINAGGSSVTNMSDARATVFYDYNDTAYYADPNSNSKFVNLGLGGVTPDVRLSVSGDAHLSSILYLGGTAGSSGSWGSRDYTTSGLRYFNASTYEFNNYGYGSTYTFTLNASLAQHSASMRAPIFYDSNNTGYYVDPASTSNLNGVLTSSAVSDNNSGLRNVLPGGGSYVTSTSSVTGAIQITLPTTNYPMVRFTVKVYTYDGLSFEISCGGHTSGNVWYNTFAYMTTQNRSALNVRFCYSGGTTYVYIGDLGSTWSYPQVFITDVQVGYATYSASQWNAGWAVAFNSSTYNNISATHTVYPPTSSSNNTNPAYASIFYDSNSTGYYVDPASTSILSSLRLTSDSALLIVAPNGAYQRVDTRTESADSRAHWYGVNSSAGTSNFRHAWYDGGAYFNVTASSGQLSFDRVGGSGYVSTSESFRAPIFYDYNDTGYYADPAGNSQFSLIYANNWFRPQGQTGVYSPSYGIHFWAQATTDWGMSFANNTSGSLSLWRDHQSTRRIYLYFDTSGSGLLTNTGNWGVRQNYDGGASPGGTLFGSWTSNGDHRAPLFYDSNDTSYYVDPNSTSSFNIIKSYALAYQGGVSADNTWGMYFDSDRSSAYAIYRGSGAWTYPYPDLRIAFHTGIQIGANASYGGVRFYTDYDMSSQIMSVGNGADALGSGNVFVNSSLQAGGSLRAPIFYDSNDTGYYVDPNGTSSMNRISSIRSDYWLYLDSNYGHSVVGVYSSYLFQGVFAMGDSYKLSAGGGVNNLYGMCWSHPNAGGAAGNLDSHGLIILINGGFASCMSYSIRASGNVTANSDERLKTNWRNVPEDFVAKLAKIKSGIYDRMDGEKLTQVGVSAQSLQTLLPEAVTEANDDIKTLSVSYGNAALASAVELAKEVVVLKEKISSQEERIAKLEELVNNLLMR